MKVDRLNTLLNKQIKLQIITVGEIIFLYFLPYNHLDPQETPNLSNLSSTA